MTSEIALDQVLENNVYNVKTLYESSEIDMEENTNFPFRHPINDCDYNESYEFHYKCFGTYKSLSVVVYRVIGIPSAICSVSFMGIRFHLTF